MSFNLANILGGGVSDAVKALSDTAHTWISTSKDKEEVLQKEEEFKLKLTQVTNDQLNKLADQAQIELDSYLKDTQSARESNTRIQESTNASWLSKNVLYLLALLVTLGFFGLLTYLLKSEIPTSNKDILNIMLGSLGTAWISIISYFFGSSLGSKSSAETIRKIAEAK